MKISVVMATYNRWQQLERGLMTLLSQRLLPDEIIVVDDGSSDGTMERLKAKYTFNSRIKPIYLDHPEPRISCIPRNVGIKQATGDVIIFSEPEALHVGNTIEQLITTMNDHPDNTILASQVWTIGQRIYQKFDEDTFRNPARIIYHSYAMLTDSEHPHNTKAPDSDFAITGEANCNAGVLFATRKQWLEEIGGYDEEFTGHGGDDFNLFDRLAMYGKGILKDPSIIVIHQWHEKNYPYNIYEHAERNLKLSAEKLASGEFRANIGCSWGEMA